MKHDFSIKLLISIFSFSLVFFSCSNFSDSQSSGSEAAGGRRYGGYLRTAETDPLQTLFPSSITDAMSAFIADQIFDCLVKFNEASLKVEPCLAEKWEIDNSKTRYKFNLKRGAFFQNDNCFPESKGREITAEDIKYSFELLCKNNAENQNFNSTFKGIVKGADDFFEGKAKNIDGFKIIDKYTFEVELLHENHMFLQILCQPTCAIIAKEAVDKYGKSLRLGSGPFFYDFERSNEKKICLSRNPNYHGKDSLGNSLPFLDSVLVFILESQAEEMKMFKDGKLDMITSIPSASVKEIVENQIKDFKGSNPKYRLDNSPEMITQFYTFNTKKAPFDNVKVRQALSYSINKQKIIEDVLAGQAFGPGINGLIPPTFTKEGFNHSLITGYDFNPNRAKKLLAEAGYPNGKGFPKVKIVLNSGGARNTDVVIEIQKQIKDVLNVDLDFYVVPSAQKLEDARFGKADIIRDAWVADYPSPETFLNLFYGKNVPENLSQPSFPNTSRFSNKTFDFYYEKGRDANSIDSSMLYFMKADQLLMNEAPLLVLWYEGSYKLTDNKVKNSYSNAMRYRNFAATYLWKN